MPASGANQYIEYPLAQVARAAAAPEKMALCLSWTMAHPDKTGWGKGAQLLTKNLALQAWSLQSGKILTESEYIDEEGYGVDLPEG